MANFVHAVLEHGEKVDVWYCIGFEDNECLIPRAVRDLIEETSRSIYSNSGSFPLIPFIKYLRTIKRPMTLKDAKEIVEYYKEKALKQFKHHGE
jgi:hypothetical protein